MAPNGNTSFSLPFGFINANQALETTYSLMPQPTNPNKKRIIKDYDTLPEDIITRVKMEYPYGFADSLVSFTNKEGKRVSALPFETEEIYYLIRMTVQEARQIISDDEDYDDEGNLRDDYAAEEEEESAEPETGNSFSDPADDADDPYDNY
jgi:DNA-directed RNA polymerase subunit delta